MQKTLGQFIYIGLLIIIFCVIFFILGKELFSSTWETYKVLMIPKRHSFNSWYQSFVTVF